MRRSWVTLCGVMVAACLAGALQADDEAALPGAWTLDRRASDDPQRVLRDGEHGGNGLGSRVARGVSIFGIPVGSLPRPERAAEDVDEDALEQELRGVEHVFEATYRLTIRELDDTTEIQYGNEPTIAYRHGSAVEREGVATRVEWESGALTVEHELADGGRVSERYVVEPRSGDLRWTVRFKRRKEGAIDIDRVFYRTPAPTP